MWDWQPYGKQEGTEALVERLRDPRRSNQALLALLAQGRDTAAARRSFSFPRKLPTLSEPRLLALKGLSILKGPDALASLIAVASQAAS